ncbi:MAG: hypothetical protein JSW27_20775 [Phycisphaerales bacterium]|nr:MAG: hypothetical protein JSW27_20775 [Phycisphaerales bacterium]
MRARQNPFAVDRVQTIRYRPLEITFDDVLARLHTLDYRAAIVGPQGSGKTTLLEDLQQALERHGARARMVFVNDTSPLDRPTYGHLMSQLSGDDIVLLDGADAIGYPRWLSLKRHILKRAAGLVITTHRPGRMPTLIRCTTTPELLTDIVDRLLPPGQTMDAAVLRRLYHHYRGNIRNCLRELYDLCAADR